MFDRTEDNQISEDRNELINSHPVESTPYRSELSDAIHSPEEKNTTQNIFFQIQNVIDSNKKSAKRKTISNTVETHSSSNTDSKTLLELNQFEYNDKLKELEKMVDYLDRSFKREPSSLNLSILKRQEIKVTNLLSALRDSIHLLVESIQLGRTLDTKHYPTELLKTCNYLESLPMRNKLENFWKRNFALLFCVFRALSNLRKEIAKFNDPVNLARHENTFSCIQATQQASSNLLILENHFLQTIETFMLTNTKLELFIRLYKHSIELFRQESLEGKDDVVPTWGIIEIIKEVCAKREILKNHYQSEKFYLTLEICQTFLTKFTGHNAELLKHYFDENLKKLGARSEYLNEAKHHKKENETITQTTDLSIYTTLMEIFSPNANHASNGNAPSTLANLHGVFKRNKFNQRSEQNNNSNDNAMEITSTSPNY